MLFNSLRKTVLSALVLLLLSAAVEAAPGNIAPKAKVTSSGSLSGAFDANNVTDGRVMWENTGEWACKGHVTSWGEMYLPWVRLAAVETFGLCAIQVSRNSSWRKV